MDNQTEVILKVHKSIEDRIEVLKTCIVKDSIIDENSIDRQMNNELEFLSELMGMLDRVICKDQ